MVYLVDRQTKQVVWRLGGKRSDFSMGPGSRFYFQHDARALADGSGLSLFDDASAPCPEKLASGKVLDLDMDAMTATLRHRYLHTDGEMNTPSQGNCQLLADGGHVVGWGYRPYFSVYAPSSEETLGAPLILDGRFPEGAASYRTFLFDWRGNPPESEMAVVVRPAGVAGQLTAWVSWNGATEVVAWRVNGGPSPAALLPLVTAPKVGFETAIEFAARRSQLLRCRRHKCLGPVPRPDRPGHDQLNSLPRPQVPSAWNDEIARWHNSRQVLPNCYSPNRNYISGAG